LAERTDQLREVTANLQRSLDFALEALGDAIDLKNVEPEGHSKRVTAYTIAIAKGMGVASEQIPIIARGAFLHDIGMMGVEDAILRKPGRLSQREVAIIRKHAYHGSQMLKRIPSLAEASEIVHSHQERFDGTGYPRGLKGTDIPLGARILAVADVFDALTSDRAYRPAISIEAAREKIKKAAGQQFDPGIVETFIQMPTALWRDLRRDIDAQIGKTRIELD
jgi:putative nucleotidyltransferase with HDIG domain